MSGSFQAWGGVSDLVGVSWRRGMKGEVIYTQ